MLGFVLLMEPSALNGMNWDDVEFWNDYFNSRSSKDPQPKYLSNFWIVTSLNFSQYNKCVSQFYSFPGYNESIFYLMSPGVVASLGHPESAIWCHCIHDFVRSDLMWRLCGLRHPTMLLHVFCHRDISIHVHNQIQTSCCRCWWKMFHRKTWMCVWCFWRKNKHDWK